MMRRSIVLAAFVLACCIAGHLVGRSQRDAEPGPRTTGASVEAAESATRPGTPSAKHREIPSRWRRPEAADGRDFVPVVVNPADLPSDSRPPDQTRDPEWAMPMEKAMNSTIASEIAELFPDVRVDDVQCMSTRCTLDLVVPPEQRDKLNAFIAMAVPMGPRVAPTFEDGAIHFDVDLSEVGDAAAWQEWHSEIRTAWRQNIEQIVAAERAGRPWHE